MVQAQVIEDEQVGREVGTEGPLQGVVDPGLGHTPEEVVGVDEAHCVTRPDGSVAQGLGEEAPAHLTAGPTSRTCSWLIRN